MCSAKSNSYNFSLKAFYQTFLFLFLFSTLPIFSQGVGQYPVQVSTVVLPNPPMYLSAYSGVETDKLSVTLLNRDTQPSSLQV
nr:hypothetical protein [Paludibacteraceae bacterium]